MLSYILKRLLMVIPVLFGVLLITYVPLLTTGLVGWWSR